jgi:hypothetical protein
MADDSTKKDDPPFREVLRDVRVIKQDRVPPHRRRRKPVPEQKRLDEQAVMDELSSGEFDSAELETGEDYPRQGPRVGRQTARTQGQGQRVAAAQG